MNENEEIKIPVIKLTGEQKRMLEDDVLKTWEGRALNQGLKIGSKREKALKYEFLLGMVATLDVFEEARKTGQSSISPRIMFGIMRGEL